MVKKISFLMLLFLQIEAQNDFETNCMSCHGEDFKFNIIMKKYTLKYSSQKAIKNAMFTYLKNPTLETSILPLEYIKKFGIKDKSVLDDTTLKEMINVYYQKYNVASKLR
jgi:hypothetical protein